MPRALDCVLVAGCFPSATHTAQASARVTATCPAMGEVAGTEVARAHDVVVRVDIADLQARLRSDGALLDP